MDGSRTVKQCFTMPEHSLQKKSRKELQDAEGLNILSQRKSGEMDEATSAKVSI